VIKKIDIFCGEGPWKQKKQGARIRKTDVKLDFKGVKKKKGGVKTTGGGGWVKNP